MNWQTVVRQATKMGIVVNLPGNLLDDVTDERGALAEVALGAGDTGLDNASGGLLYWGKSQPVSVHLLQ